jgi:hypothetical protein
MIMLGCTMLSCGIGDDVVFITCINDALGWDSMATIKRKNCFKYAIAIPIGLYWIHQHTLIKIQKLWSNQTHLV